MLLFSSDMAMADLSRGGFTIFSLHNIAGYCLLHRVISRELNRPGLVKVFDLWRL